MLRRASVVGTAEVFLARMLDTRGRIAFMITRFEVDGFKSLRSFAVDLEPLTAFVGPNGAGKSNLLEAMALLGRLTSLPVEQAFKMGRGRILDQFSRSGGQTGNSIRFAVDVSLPTPIIDDAENALPTRYRYELVIERQTRDSGLEELVVADESLKEVTDGDPARIGVVMWQVDGTLKGDRLLRLWAEPGSVRNLRVGSRSFTTIAAFAKAASNKKNTLSADGVVRPDTVLSIIEAVAQEIGRFHLIHLDAARLREPTEKVGSGILAPDASNLAAVLADLPAPVLGSIKADLVSLIPGLAGFDIVADGDSLRIDFKLSGGDVLPARLASDGTLRALALLAVLTVEPHSSVIAIEEPENGIYPGRLRRLVTLLRDLSLQDGKIQVLLTTHSPVVVAALRDKPELLRVVDIIVRDGKRDTRARSVGKPKQPGDSAFIASLREVDTVLHSADAEAAE
jgi:predicted ATPase